jgi:hypothetical protein
MTNFNQAEYFINDFYQNNVIKNYLIRYANKSTLFSKLVTLRNLEVVDINLKNNGNEQMYATYKWQLKQNIDNLKGEIFTSKIAHDGRSFVYTMNGTSSETGLNEDLPLAA